MEDLFIIIIKCDSARVLGREEASRFSIKLFSRRWWGGLRVVAPGEKRAPCVVMPDAADPQADMLGVCCIG